MKFTLKTTILLSLMFFSLILTNGCTNKETLNVHSINTPNPWTNCNQDLSCAAKIAGFKFPIKITDIQISAMKGNHYGRGQRVRGIPRLRRAAPHVHELLSRLGALREAALPAVHGPAFQRQVAAPDDGCRG